MRKINYSLVIGIALVVLLIILVNFGDKIAKIDPYALKIGEFKELDGKLTYVKPPFKPNGTYLFGTDILGRDIFSRIIYGAKITLKLALFTTILRFIVSIPISFLAGFGNKISRTAIKYFSTIFSSIPALIISMIILKIPTISRLEIDKSIIAFGVVLTFVEWGRLAKILENNVKDVLDMNFIKGEIAIGKNRFNIAFQNVIPHMVAPLIIHFFMEMSRSLVLIAQLGVFGVYAGGNKLNMRMISDMSLGIVPEYYPEWGGMLAASRYAISIKKPWIVMYTVGAFFISVLGFNMLGEGLKTEVNKRNSMALTYTKRTFSHLNPKTYLYEIKNIKKYRISVLIKTAVIVLIIVALLIPPPSSMFEVNTKEVFNHVEEFNNDKYEGRISGSLGRDNATKYIVDKLKNSNIEPLFDGEYTDEFVIKSEFADLKSSRIYIKDSNGNETISFDFRKDYVFRDIVLSKEETTATIITSSEFKKDNYSKDKRYFVIIDEEVSYEDMNQFAQKSKYREIETIAKFKNVEGILFPLDKFNGEDYKMLYDIKDYDYYHNKSKKRFFTPYIVPIQKEVANKIIQNEGKEIVLENRFNEDDRVGINIGGIIHPKQKSDETIMVVTNYDYLGYDGDTKFKGLLYNSTSVAASIEMINKLSVSKDKPNKNIIFLFLDSSKIDMEGVENFIAKHRNIINQETFMIGMNYLGVKESDTLYLDNSSIPSDKQKFQDYINYIRERANENDTKLEQGILSSQVDDIYELISRTDASGILLKSISGENVYKYYNRKQDDIALIDEVKLKDQTQLILDLISHIAY